ncbi:myosin phosphatase Rho-interacting protein-like isoform X5 [Heptranchias perlo]|uniref:myosin phosphatase Rho-interacting protein-like isoform X5 n=1 Tax=Heptranchias perlo TaxID=212740 RepID=UPI003559B173
MSAKENAACRKFQANIFNQSKCQNCFKPRESHLTSDQDLNQAKPIYGGWLLLAPEGTDFENPVQRSRKWQRRFFLLYEHGLLRYALDDSPTTLPQGTINMNLSTDVTDGESKTAQKNSLCILMPEKHHFIRAENKETINGWFDALIMYPRTNKQNQKKKRKVEPPTPQEPGPAKVAVTSNSMPSAERIPSTKSTLWQEELKNKGLHVVSNLMRNPSQNQSPIVTSSGPSGPKEAAQGVVNGDEVDGRQKKRVESGYFSLEKVKSDSKQLTSPPSSSTTNRYSSPKSGMVIPCHSSLYSDPFPPTGNLLSNGSCVSSSQSSLDSETSGVTLTSIASSNSKLGEGPIHSPARRINRDYATLADIPKARRISNKQAFRADEQQLEQRFRTRSPGKADVARLFGSERRRSQVIEQFEALEIESAQQMESSSSTESNICNKTRQGRSEKRSYPRKRDFMSESDQISSAPDVSAVPLPQYRRAKSLDRRATESAVTPDLLNFKKGWMTKLSADGQWKKHWFVLIDQVLKYYRDSAAEEAVDLDGEIDLSSCYDVTEYEVQRNYGFQIHTKAKAYILSAMTSGIRRNWIQAIMKTVRPATTPDVTRSLPEEKLKVRTLFEGVSVNGGKPAATSTDGAGLEAEHKKSRARERRKEGRSKTFDWAEFRPSQQRPSGGYVRRPTTLYLRTTTNSETDSRELERDRARRREERRKRFETTNVSFSPGYDNVNRMEVDGATTTSISPGPKNVHVEIEHRWQQVECTPLREEKQVPILTAQTSSEGRSPVQDLALMLDKELEQSQQELSRLHEQNRELQGQLRAALEREHNARDGYVLQHAKNLASVRVKYEEILQKEWHDYTLALAGLEKENEALRRQAFLQDSELELTQKELQEMEERHKHDLLQTETRYQLELSSKLNNMEEMLKQRTADQNQEQKHREQIKKLEESLQDKIQELLRMHQEEKHNLCVQYEEKIRQLEESLEHHSENSEMIFYQTFLMQNSDCHDEPGSLCRAQEDGGDSLQVKKQAELDSMTVLHERIQELETQMDMMRDELGQKHLEGTTTDLREKYQRDFDNLKATCERGFTAMEESHQKVIEELQRQHQRELEKLQQEKDRLLAEETAATIAAIEAMKNAHREELKRELEKSHRSRISGTNADIEALGKQHKEEMGSVQRELQVLSEQYSHKCLENAHLAQALEAERQALRQCQRENQELNAHNQELNNRLAAEFARLRALVTGEGKGEGAGSPLSLGKDVYELEVLLRVKESEIQYLKQEINSLKDELQTALRDKKYSTDKYKDIYTELSIVRAKADCDVNRLKEQLKSATEALGEKTMDCGVTGYDIMKSKSNPDFLKKDKLSTNRPMRTLRSKSLKEGLTVQERMKLFEPKD